MIYASLPCIAATEAGRGRTTHLAPAVWPKGLMTTGILRAALPGAGRTSDRFGSPRLNCLPAARPSRRRRDAGGASHLYRNRPPNHLAASGGTLGRHRATPPA